MNAYKKKSIIAPKLQEGHYSIIQADVNTGHIFQTNGKLYTGNGEVFKSFDGISEAEAYIEDQIVRNNNLEFVIYDFNGREILYISRYQKKKIEE